MRRSLAPACSGLLAIALLCAVAPSHAAGPFIAPPGAFIRDSLGRAVFLRGIAMVDKRRSSLPPANLGDFENIRSLGMNMVRLAVLWSAIEPQPGRIDPSYLAAIQNLVQLADEAGISVIVDMHQDVYSQVFVGDGAPAWTIDALTTQLYQDPAESTGTWQLNYFDPGVGSAFTRLWTNAAGPDNVGLLDHQISAWSAVASALQAYSNVAGYDLYNEPACGARNQPGDCELTLDAYYASAGAALRKSDPGAVFFFEPPNEQNVQAPVVPVAPALSNLVYSPHVYGLWGVIPGLSQQQQDNLIDESLDASAADAAAMHTPLWFGETCYGGDANADYPSYMNALLERFDQKLAGFAIWEYGLDTWEWEKGGCAVFSITDGRAPYGSTYLATEATRIKTLTRPQPLRVPGHPASLSFDPTSSIFTLATAVWHGVDATKQRAEESVAVIRVPAGAYPNGFSVTVSEPSAFATAVPIAWDGVDRLCLWLPNRPSTVTIQPATEFQFGKTATPGPEWINDAACAVKF